MITVTRKVFYCEFCKRHRLSSRAIEDHEPRCIYNPNRECRWQSYLLRKNHGKTPTHVLAEEIRRRTWDWIDWLRERTDGCPTCMLAAAVQSGLSYEVRSEEGFDYREELERFRDEERRAEYMVEIW